jgi:hypothetical protein
MNAMSRLIGMLRSPRQTLAAAIDQPRYLDPAIPILLICAACSVGFLLTRVGYLAAVDQQVRQLESLGTVVTDGVYANVRAWAHYRPLISAGTIVAGWPLAWAAGAWTIRALARRWRTPGVPQATFAQVYTVLVHASSVFALRAVIAAPVDYVRESLGGATSVAMILPGLGDGTFAARLFGSIDIFALWWVALAAIGLGMLYHVRAFSIGRWLVGAYAAAAAALALTQALRGGA